MKRPIVDSHTHFINPDMFKYWWMPYCPTLNKQFNPQGLSEALGDLDLEKIVFVQADVAPEDAMQEVQWVASFAKNDPRIQAIVAFVPLNDPQTAKVQLEKLAQMPLVKGVRQPFQLEDAGFCLQPQLIEVIQTLPSYGLSLDICVYHHQLADVIQLAKKCPNVNIVLDHLGKPDAKTPEFSPWDNDIAELALCENVMCKISGLVTEADIESWSKEALKPYIDCVVNAFGVERIMFGGDWPISLLATTYQAWVNTVDWATESLSHDDKDKLFYKNASRFYRI